LVIGSVGPPTLKLAVTALTAELRYARKTWVLVVVGFVAFVAWFIGSSRFARHAPW
jgi:hypothetical protein